VFKIDKRSVRQQLVKERKLLSTQQVLASDQSGVRLGYNLISECSPKNAAVYWSVGNEFSTRGLIRVLMEANTCVALPRINTDDQLQFYQFESSEKLYPGRLNIPEPPENSCLKIEAKKFDLIIVPGVAFDRQLNRLGMGKGYYDRFLSNISPSALTIGLAYEFQILPIIPVEETDVPLKKIWTVNDGFI
jgi:5-formyltetrahydrofolate cyclo-ligase